MENDPNPNMVIEYSELHGAVDAASGDAAEASFFDLASGEIISDPRAESEVEGEEGESGDVEGEDLFVPVPSWAELGVGGHDLALRFADVHLPERRAEIVAMFQGGDGYAAFRTLLEREGLFDAWHAWRDAAEELALRKWAEDLGIELTGR